MKRLRYVFVSLALAVFAVPGQADTRTTISTDQPNQQRPRYIRALFVDTVANRLLEEEVTIDTVTGRLVPDSYATQAVTRSSSATVAPSSTAVAPAQSPSRSTACQVRVMVPSQDAAVYFQGHQTQQTGTDRLFVSPPLDADAKYTYTVKAEWMENGQKISREKSVSVTAGGFATADFSNRLPAASTGPSR